MVRNYPKKYSVRRVIEEHLSAKDTKEFLQTRGILAICNTKKDLAKVGGDYYLNQKDYEDLKGRMDVEQNYKKSGRISFQKEHLKSLQESFEALGNRCINKDDNTKLTVSKNADGSAKILLTYDEYKPSMIDLLDVTKRQVEIKLNTHGDNCSLDFDMQAAGDYKKVKELTMYITDNDEDITFEFQEISLNELKKSNRIELFERFFKAIDEPWELVEIKKIKVKRDSTEKKIDADQLAGINSAVLDGDNLKENKFVKSTLDKGFYFSMASMRLDHINSNKFIDLVIDFKTRPEMCEVKISHSGVYVAKDDGDGFTELKSVMEGTEQEKLLLEYKNTLYEIFLELSNAPMVNVEFTASNEVAASTEDDIKK
ncbi:hypothetical protein [Bacillus cereus]|uniref:hypothetical protein n=1 Tax=Bacillus cereus TaxID=1396 RepID=UPI000BFA3EBF|nr:hypothetical protein [Bacillus cereus]PFL36705.1 hypothetical protein COJ06_16525 [Bacillus cereus]PGQ67143.1 hypothetical protein COA27_25325 [Bacillus cereus]